MIIPLGLGAYKRNAAFAPEVVCLNMVLEKDVSGISPDKIIRVQRPGLVKERSFDAGPVQMIDARPASADLLVVSGGRLYDNGIERGIVGGGRIVPMAGTLFSHAILGDSLFLYDSTGLTPVAMPDDAPPIVDVEQLNGYILILTRTGRFYWIKPNEKTVAADAYANAESSGDGGVAIRRIGDEFWIFGTRTIEPWQSTGDELAPFQRALGRLYERGCRSRDTVRRFDNSLMWVGDDNEVYRGAEVPQVVSDPGLSERIRVAGGDLSAWTFGLDGHEFYVLNIGDQGTYVFDASTTAWARFSSGNAVSWRAYVGNQEGGDLFAGDEGGSLYRISASAATDDGVPFPRILTATVPLTTKPPRNDSLSIGTGSSADFTVRFRWRDGQDDYPAYYDETLARAPIDVATIYRLGQPDQPYRTFEVSVVDPVLVRISGLVANEGWR